MNLVLDRCEFLNVKGSVLDRLNDLATRAVEKIQSIPIVDLYTEHPIFRINSKNLLVQYKEFDEGANLIREARYAYDALGRRIEKVVIDLQVPTNNKTRRYVYDGEDILKVFDESNNVLSKYTHSSLRVDDALVIDDKVNNKSYYFLKDHLGSVIDIVNDDLSFKQHYAYSSFGELQKVTDIGGNDVTSNPILEHHYTYTGREYDFESGLYHYRARAYDASIGRFLQVDPHPGVALEPLTNINKYIYVTNNPLVNVDPMGLIKFRSALALGASFAAGFAIGFVAGAALGPIGGMLIGAIGGYFVGGEIAYRTNRILGGSHEESSKLRSDGKLAGAIGGILGGLVGAAVAGNGGSEQGQLMEDSVSSKSSSVFKGGFLEAKVGNSVACFGGSAIALGGGALLAKFGVHPIAKVAGLLIAAGGAVGMRTCSSLIEIF